MIEQQVSPVKTMGRAVKEIAINADALMYGLSSSIDEVGKELALCEAYEAGVEGKLPKRVAMAMAFREVLHGIPNDIENAFKEGSIARIEGQLTAQRDKIMKKLAERNRQLKALVQEHADDAVSFSAVTLIGAGLAGAGMMLDRVSDRASIGNKSRNVAKLVASGLTHGGTALAFGGAVESVASGVSYAKTSIDGFENALRAKALSGLDLNDKARQFVTERFAR